MVLLLPVTAFAQQKVTRPGDPVFGVDKVKHFFIAGFVESMTFSGALAAGVNRGGAKTSAISLTAAVSLAREIHDRRTKGLFSIRDLAWDAIGATAAMLILNRTQK